MHRSLRATGLLACFVVAGCTQILDFDRSKIPSTDAGGRDAGEDSSVAGDSGAKDGQVESECDRVTHAGCEADELCCDANMDGKFACIPTDPLVQCERCGMPCNTNTADDCSERTCGCGSKSKVVCSGDLSLCDPTTRECVECLVHNDCQGNVGGEYCFAPGTSPSPLDHTCVECDPATNAGCRGTKPICNSMGVCVPCNAGPKTCESPLVCLPNGACECSENAQCTTPTAPICDKTSKVCEGCASNQECMTELNLPYCVSSQRCGVCNPNTEVGCSDPNKPDCRFNASDVYECLPCTNNTHCANLGTSDTCDVATGDCVPCLVNTDCDASAYCSNKLCVAKKVNGASCTTTGECTSGNCVDGVCCDDVCGGTCQACSSSKKGTGANGTCGSVVASADPDNECAGALTCNGSGACEKELGAACVTGSECDSAFCADGVCCNQACTGTCEGCTNALRGTGSDGTCGPLAADTDPGAECEGALSCSGIDGVGCQKAQGQACGAGAECGNGRCVDGFCCDSACSGTCEACSAALSTGADGTCSPVDANTDPGDECTGDLACAGTRSCEKANGEACASAGECDSGFCVDGVCCNQACLDEDALCSACSAAKKGQGVDGTCGFIALGTDPDNECVSMACDGAGSCQL